MSALPQNLDRSDTTPLLTVSALTLLVKEIVEGTFPLVWVSGEISNFSRPQSGRCYVTLKDGEAQIRGVLGRGRVHGRGAAGELARAIGAVSRLAHMIDVLVIGHGGGSLEALWAFNEEIVVRAIHASRIPVVSAVGHEIDVTLADLVADLRALTPAKRPSVSCRPPRKYAPT